MAPNKSELVEPNAENDMSGETEEREERQAIVLRHPAQLQTIEWTEEQKQIIKDQFCKNANDTEFAALMAIAKVKGLDPLKRQIYFRKQGEWDESEGKYVDRWITITGIDGFRVLADRTGLYDGQDEPLYECDGDRLIAARVMVYRKGISRAFVGVAYLVEFIQTKKDGTPNKMWSKMPRSQLAKCAEALAFRKAFPDDCGGLYAPEEFPQDDPGEANARTAERMSAKPQQQALESAQPAALAAPPPQPKVEQFVNRFAEAKTVPEVETIAQEAAKEAFTAAERKVVIGAYRTAGERLKPKQEKPSQQAQPQREREAGEEG